MKSIKKVIYLIGLAATIIIIVGLFFFCRFIIQVKKAITSVDDINRYESILEEWKEFAPDIVSHFPEVIPSDAQNTEFYYRPGFLQSDSRIELQYRTTSEKIESLYKKFSKIKTMSSYGGTLVHFPPNGEDADIIELGKDWEIMHFDKDPENLPEYSKEHGVMITREKNEIIYWAEW